MCTKVCQGENYSIELTTDHQKGRCSKKDQCSKKYFNIQNTLKHLEQLLADHVLLRNIHSEWIFCFIIWNTRAFCCKIIQEIFVFKFECVQCLFCDALHVILKLSLKKYLVIS